ncbi:hypothetical protein D3C85_1650450 [compost metagenome]
MLEFRFSHASTARRSLIFLSSSSTDSVGAAMPGTTPMLPHRFFTKSSVSVITAAPGMLGI